MDWRSIEGYEGHYEINEDGIVRSIERYVPVHRSDGSVRERLVRSRALKTKRNHNDSTRVGLSLEGNVEEFYVHELLRRTFKKDKFFLNFLNRDNTDVRLSNMIFIDHHESPYTFKGRLKEDDLTQEILQQCFKYKNGNLYWKERPANHFKNLSDYRAFLTNQEGKVAGYYNKRTDSKRKDFGYWRVGITLGDAQAPFKLHRLIFLLEKGYLPKVVDHKDGDQNNNNIENLREGDHKKNSYNLRTPVNNTSGYKGVSKSKDPKRRNKPYKASIEWDGYVFGLGAYTSAEEAAVAYNIAAKLLFKDFSKLNVTPFKEEDFQWKGKFFTKDYSQILEGTFDWDSKSQRKKK
ncbi:HNH endonuclease [Vibrio phage K406]